MSTDKQNFIRELIEGDVSNPFILFSEYSVRKKKMNITFTKEESALIFDIVTKGLPANKLEALKNLI